MAVSTAASTNELLLAASEQVEYQEPGWFAVILIGILAITGSVFVLVSARAMYLAPDALSQPHKNGPALGGGIPLLICGNLVFHFATEGFVLGYLILACVAIAAFLGTSSVGSFCFGRALHATNWDHTVPLSGSTRPT